MSHISEAQLRNQYFIYHRYNSLSLSRDAIRRPELLISGYMLQMYDYKPEQNSYSLYLISSRSPNSSTTFRKNMEVI